MRGTTKSPGSPLSSALLRLRPSQDEMSTNTPAPVCKPSLLLLDSSTPDLALLKIGAKMTWHTCSLTLAALLPCHQPALTQQPLHTLNAISSAGSFDIHCRAQSGLEGQGNSYAQGDHWPFHILSPFCQCSFVPWTGKSASVPLARASHSTPPTCSLPARLCCLITPEMANDFILSSLRS